MLFRVRVDVSTISPWEYMQPKCARRSATHIVFVPIACSLHDGRWQGSAVVELELAIRSSAAPVVGAASPAWQMERWLPAEMRELLVLQTVGRAHRTQDLRNSCLEVHWNCSEVSTSI